MSIHKKLHESGKRGPAQSRPSWLSQFGVTWKWLGSIQVEDRGEYFWKELNQPIRWPVVYLKSPLDLGNRRVEEDEGASLLPKVKMRNSVEFKRMRRLKQDKRGCVPRLRVAKLEGRALMVQARLRRKYKDPTK